MANSIGNFPLLVPRFIIFACLVGDLDGVSDAVKYICIVVSYLNIGRRWAGGPLHRG